MNQFKKHIKNFNIIFCTLVSMLAIAGHSAPTSNSSTNASSPESVWNEMKAHLATNDKRTKTIKYASGHYAC